MMKRMVISGLVVVALLVSLTACNLLGLGGSGGTRGATSAELVAAGIAALTPNVGMPDMDTARLKFAQAVQKDSSNGEAIMWSSMMELAAIAVDPAMVTILDTYFGIPNYPATLNELIGGSWMTTTVEGIPLPLPGIVIDERIADLFAEMLAPGESMPEEAVSVDVYVANLVENIIMGNQAGFDAINDAVIALLVAKLDGIIDMINSLPATAKISFPDSLTGAGFDIAIGKAELQLEAAALYNIKSSLYLGKAISLSFPMNEYWDALNPFDNLEAYEGVTTEDEALMVALGLLVELNSPFAPSEGGAPGFLMPRADSQASLELAETATLAALNTMKSAVMAIRGRTSADGFSFGPELFSDLAMEGPNWADVQLMTDFLYNLFDKMTVAIEEDAGILYIPMFQGIADLLVLQESEVAESVKVEFDSVAFMDYIELYSDPAEWPTATDLGAPGTWPDTLPLVIAIRPGAAFQTPLFAISNLLDMDTGTGEPRYYAITMDEAGLVTSIATDAATYPLGADADRFAIKLRDLAFSSLVLTEEEFDEIMSALITMLDAPKEETEEGIEEGTEEGIVSRGTMISKLIFYEEGRIAAYLPIVNSDIVEGSLSNTKSFWWALPEIANNLLVFQNEEVGFSEPGPEPEPEPEPEV